MRIIYSIYRDYDAVSGKILRDDLIADLKTMGLPGPIADQLLHSDQIHWTGEIDEIETVLAIDILDDKRPIL